MEIMNSDTQDEFFKFIELETTLWKCRIHGHGATQECAI